MAENEIICEREIRINGWFFGGGDESQKWSYKPKDGIIRRIIVACGSRHISSICFVDGSMEYSPVFGATASDDDLTTQININHPAEEEYYDDNYYDEPFACQMEGGKVVGFHGRASSIRLESLGVYVKAICSVCVPAQINPCAETQRQVAGIFNDTVPRYPGPWGGCGGKQWDDGVFSAVKGIHLHFTSAFTTGIHGIQFEYLGGDGRSIWSARHGAKSQKVVKIEIDGDDEFLIGLAGFYGRMNGCKGLDDGGIEVIKSLTFYTNKGSYGPYGDGNGNYFTSMACGNGKVVGFRGSSGTHLNAIGLHLQYV
ncbi:Agglutinin [Sesamum alatum]|uniref:Agglutinin n=1 Tax=Sesamum alatum TaxID=300844 RepID=A0AAE1YG50_9LAMI|nr:Agglutinin [Sesamum alatum]